MSDVLRIAVIGSGPAGFYAAAHLLRQSEAEVDMYERLPTPWGLVRGGVAPDHPKIKSVSRVYEKTASHPRFRFFGNVEVGVDVGHDELSQWYDAVLYAVGTSADRRAGIPGEELPGSHSATDFVGWYNGHPDHRDLEFDLLRSTRAVVIGNGNVALDIARMLCLTPEELKVTDIADHALEVLRASSITEVVVLGRRGPEQAAFTNPELLELGELQDADIIVDPSEVEVPERLRDENADATALRNLEILREYSMREPQGKRKRILLRFQASPVELIGEQHVREVRVARNDLVRDGEGVLRARPNGAHELIESGLVLRAIGYTGRPLAGLPFDRRRGRFPHDGEGRLTTTEGELLAGAYVAGWIKRGPSGVIGTNKKCAQETVDVLLSDAEAGRLLGSGRGGPDGDTIEERLRERKPNLITYAGWEAIDAHERGLGEPQGRPRVKLTRVDELLEAAMARSAR
jgi:ferredoxin--NADP+ reductase